MAPAGAGLVAAARFLVHRRPSAALSFFVADAAILIAFLDMRGLALLLIGIFVLVTPWHSALLSSSGIKEQWIGRAPTMRWP